VDALRVSRPQGKHVRSGQISPRERGGTGPPGETAAEAAIRGEIEADRRAQSIKALIVIAGRIEPADLVQQPIAGLREGKQALGSTIGSADDHGIDGCHPGCVFTWDQPNMIQ
jgi:hypothetical protein